MLTTQSNRFVFVIRALAAVAAPMAYGCSPAESPRGDGAVQDGANADGTAMTADATSMAADTGVDFACGRAALEPWGIEDLTSRGYCAGPSLADPPFDTELSSDAGSQDGMAPEPVVGRPCTVLAAECQWSGGMRGSNIGYTCRASACAQDGSAPLAWTMMRLAGGPMTPPELEG